VKTLTKLLDSDSNYIDGFPSDFSIDASYELAKVIRGLHSNGPLLGINKETFQFFFASLTFDQLLPDDEALFCTSYDSKCAIHPREIVPCGNSTESRLDILKSTLIAVKTCKKFHSDRLSIISKTW